MSFKDDLMHARDNKRGVAYLIADELIREDADPDGSMPSNQIHALFAKSLGVVLRIAQNNDEAQELIVAALLSGNDPQAVKQAIKDYWAS